MVWWQWLIIAGFVFSFFLILFKNLNPTRKKNKKRRVESRKVDNNNNNNRTESSVTCETNFDLLKLTSVGIGFVTVAITLGIAADVLKDIEEYQTAGPDVLKDIEEYQTAGLQELASWLPTIALVITAVVVIAVVVFVMYFTFGREEEEGIY